MRSRLIQKVPTICSAVRVLKMFQHIESWASTIKTLS